MSVKVVTQFTYKPIEGRYKFTKEDHALTVPGQAYGIPELLQRHSQGILTDVGLGKDPIYLDTDDHDDEDMEKLSVADMVDQEEYLARTREMKPVVPKDDIEAQNRDATDAALNPSREERHAGATSGSGPVKKRQTGKVGPKVTKRQKAQPGPGSELFEDSGEESD